MRIILLSLFILLVGCSNKKPIQPEYTDTTNSVIVCTHKYDDTLEFKFREQNVTIFQRELFGQVIRIYEIHAVDGQTYNLNEAQWRNFNCKYAM